MSNKDEEEQIWVGGNDGAAVMVSGDGAVVVEGGPQPDYGEGKIEVTVRVPVGGGDVGGGGSDDLDVGDGAEPSRVKKRRTGGIHRQGETRNRGGWSSTPTSSVPTNLHAVGALLHSVRQQYRPSFGAIPTSYNIDPSGFSFRGQFETGSTGANINMGDREETIDSEESHSNEDVDAHLE
ncbi:hypothetical protein V2J09_000829 [Rumex salicifolius]